MLKHHDDVREAPEALRPLPEIPEGVVAPDDLRALDVHTPPPRASTAVRWLRWSTLLAVVVVALGIAIATTRDGGTDVQRDPSPRLTEQVPSGSPFDAPLTTPRITDEVPSGSPFDAPSNGR